MKRLLALAFLLLTACFLVDGALDSLHHQPGECHLACVDDCGMMTVGRVLVPPPPDPLPEPPFTSECPLRPLARPHEPEKTPPRRA
jgi:hypothetical protein